MQRTIREFQKSITAFYKENQLYIITAILAAAVYFIFKRFQLGQEEYEARRNARQRQYEAMQASARKSQLEKDRKISLKRKFLLELKDQTILVAVKTFLRPKGDFTFADFDDSDLLVLQELVARHEVYFVLQTDPHPRFEEFEPTIQRQIKSRLDVPAHRIMFCNTVIGKIGMVRQMNPSLYVGWNSEAIISLDPHLKDILQVSEFGSTNFTARSAKSLTDAFASDSSVFK